MTEATLSAKVTADIADFTKKLDTVQTSLDTLAKPRAVELQGLDFTKMADGMASAGAMLTQTLSVAAVPLGALGALATRTAIDFESSFAGVKKTVEATDAEFKQLELGIRALAQQIPVPVNELNKIAETAGEIGIAKEAIVEFTQVVANMAATTNMSADAAANGFARIGSIMGVASGDFSRLGSTIVDLGNKGSSTESEIVNMALRISGAARSAGITTPEMLGLSAALANVGIGAESGGTAMSKLIINLAGIVSAGGDKLQQFSAVAGLSADRFAEAFRTNAASAIALFIQGLGGIQKSGGDLFGTLDELHIKEIRLRDAILRSASASEQFTQTLDTGRTAWEQNSALTDEAAKRYQTTASQLQLFQQKLTDVQITLGTAFLPMLVSVVQAGEPFIRMLANTANAFARLDPATQTSIVAMVGLAAVIGPALLALSALVRSVQTLIPVMTAMNAVLAANPYTALALATVAIAGLVIANWDTIKGAAIAAWTATRDAVVGAGKAIYEGLIQWLVDKASAIAAKVQGVAESIAKPFIWLKDHLVTHSVIPDMVDEIGATMARLPSVMAPPAEQAVAQVNQSFAGIGQGAQAAVPVTGAAFNKMAAQAESFNLTQTSAHRTTMSSLIETIQTGKSTWAQAQTTMANVAVQTWGSITSTVSGALAQQLISGNDWAQTLKSLQTMVLSNFLNMAIQMTTQWAISQFSMTAAAVAGDAARVASAATATGAMAALWTGLTATMTTAWSVMTGALTMLWTGFVITAKVLMLGLAHGLVAIVGLVVGAIAVVMNGVSVVISFALTAVADLLFAAAGAVQSIPIIGQILGAIMFAAGAVVQGLAVAVPGIMAGLAAGLVAGVGALAGAIPAFATGGAVFGPTLALVGENASRSNPEFIGHANQLGLNGGGSITVVVELDGRVLMESVAPRMVQFLRLKQGALA